MLALLGVVALMTLGQVLFKLAARHIEVLTLSVETAWNLATNPYLVAGIVVYGVTTVLWVFVLTSGDLSRSYPFVALTMVLVPLCGVVLFHEPLSPALLAGGALILAGLGVIAYF